MSTRTRSLFQSVKRSLYVHIIVVLVAALLVMIVSIKQAIDIWYADPYAWATLSDQ